MNTKQLFDNFPELETQRLFLKKINEGDLLQLFEINNDPDVIKNITYGKIFNLHDTFETIINYYPSLFNSKKGIAWGMYQKLDNKLIGIRMCFVDGFEEPVTIQGQILPEYRHQGFTLEAYIEIIRLLRSFGVEKIKANCDNRNNAAIGLLEKLGFTKRINYSMMGPYENVLLFHKDLTIENTKLFYTNKIESPNNFDEACELALKMYLNKEFAFAKEYINLAVNLEPENAKVYLIKAKISKALEGNRFAMLDYLVAIELDDTLSEAYRELGICQFNISKYSDAHESWEKAMRLGDSKSKELILKNPL